MGDWTWDEDDVRDLRGLPHGQDRWGERRDNGDEAWNRRKAKERAAAERAKQQTDDATNKETR